MHDALQIKEARNHREDRDVYSLLFFAEEAGISINGQPVAGKPYVTDIWKPSIGGDRSSCGIRSRSTPV